MKCMHNQTYAYTILTDYCIAQTSNALDQLTGILQFLFVNTFDDLKSSCRIVGMCPSLLYMKHSEVGGANPIQDFSQEIWHRMEVSCKNQHHPNSWPKLKYEDDAEKMVRLISVSAFIYFFDVILII